MRRAIHTSVSRLANLAPAAAAPVKPVRRVGALRGGFTGFVCGVALTGGAAYYYLFDEYQAGQQAILADVVTLRQSIQELRSTVSELRESARS